jgi:aldose 1-epimerase
VDLGCGFDPDEWPFGGRVRQRIRLAADHLELHAVITAGPRAMPAALGWHPWFQRTGGEPRLSVDAARVLLTERMIPTGRTVAVTGPTDLRAGPWLGDRRLDHTFVAPRSPVVATWPDLELRVEFGRPIRALVVYTPPRGLCLEPQTAWPNALGAMTAASGVRILEPGRTLQATMRLRWRVPRPA